MTKYENDIYDITKAFEAIEHELMSSMVRNLKRHRAWEDSEEMLWEQWQVLQLKALDDYKKKNAKKFGTQFKSINKKIDALISVARKEGNTSQEVYLLNAIKNGYTKKRTAPGTYGEFFKINDRKMDALIKATKEDFQNGEVAMLRQANDQYRKIIFNAQVYANSGAGTYEKAIDMATKDFISRGINCIEYKNGARHTLQNYSNMCLRTASKRAYLTGEGEKRKEWGEHLVIMNKRGNPCPLCAKWVGKVLIDDVWSGGSIKDGNYPLMSTAIESGLYHPNCKDGHTTYFEEIDPIEEINREDLETMVEDYNTEAKQQYARRQADKYNRLSEYALDSENKKIYGQRKLQFEKKVTNGVFNGARSIMEMLARDEKAENYYNLIRNRVDDVSKIVESSGFSLSDVKAIKEHVFINTHKLNYGVGQFDASYDMAVAWQRLINGVPEERDILLLNHELLESKVEKAYNLSYMDAHEIAEKEYAWDKEIDRMLGDDGESANIDELIKTEQ